MGAIARKMYATEPDPAELEAGRKLVLELLDVYIAQAAAHEGEHGAGAPHSRPGTFSACRVQQCLELAEATRQRVENGEL